MVTQISALIDSSASERSGGEGRFLFLIQDRWGGTCTCTHTHINTHAGEWCHLRSVNRNSRTTNQHALFSKLQGKLECESRMKGWSTDRAAERGRSFSPDYGAATDYGLRDYEGLTKKKKKKKSEGGERQTSRCFCVLFSECVCCLCASVSSFLLAGVVVFFWWSCQRSRSTDAHMNSHVITKKWTHLYTRTHYKHTLCEWMQ